MSSVSDSVRDYLSYPIQYYLTSALYITLVTAALFMPLAYSQDMPTAEEMQEMMEGMQQMQQEMEKLDPETRKQLEQMMANPPVSGSADDGAQPVRDGAKLAAVSTDALSADELKAYIEALQPKLTAAITAEARARAESINTELSKTSDYLPRLRAAANGLAAWGAWPEATWLMGKVAFASGNVQDLSNLAAFLSMLHAETAALPILYTLNARYPNNSTLLNNLGQARYGLGDNAEGEKLLVAALQITPLHPQANMTIARIQMARGDSQGAQISLHKALQGGFSNAKEEQLRKAGGKLNADDVRWRRPMPQDPLGMEKFVIPAYPMKAMDLPKAAPEWKIFKQGMRDMVSRLEQQQQSITNSMNSKSQGAMLQVAIATAQAPFILKASALMGNITEQYEISFVRQVTALTEATQADGMALVALRQKFIDIQEAAAMKFANSVQPEDYHCPETLAEIDKYLTRFNSVYVELQNDRLATQRRYLNEIAYLSQYTSATPELFEAAKLLAQGTYAQSLRDLPVALVDGIVDSQPVCFEPPTAVKGGGKLTHFDDFHCEYISTMTMPGVGKIISRCNVTEAVFEPIFAPGKASWATEIDDNNNNHFTRASAEVSIEGVKVGGHSEFDAEGVKSGGLSVGVTTDVGPKLKGGPLEIGVEAGVTAGLEFDRSGITDVSINAGVESKSSSTIGDTGMGKSESSMTAGANSTWSWNSGFSGEVSAGFDSSVF